MVEGAPVTVEHERHAHGSPTPPTFDHLAEGCGEHEDAPVARLAHLGTQADDCAGPIDIAPLQAQYLPTSPAGEVGEVENVLGIGGEEAGKSGGIRKLHEAL